MPVAKTAFIALFATMIPLAQVAACEETSTNTSPTSSSIRLSELHPNPNDGEEEFIEIENTGESDADLVGWSLVDAGGKTYTFASNTVIAAHDWFAIPHSASKISLNNEGDRIELRKPDGSVLDATEFQTTDTGASWSRIGDAWFWSMSPTPNEKNKENPPAEEEMEKEAEEEKKNTEETSTATMTSSDIHIYELLPNPSGSESTDEWIELFNAGSSTVNLLEWQLTDEHTFYKFPDVEIDAGEFLLVEGTESNLALNNSGDTLYLIDPFANIIEGVTYADASENMSWARTNEGWAWTSTSTPGETNRITSDGENNEDQKQQEEEKREEEEESATMNLTNFRQLEDNGVATIEGVVTVLPGIFGTQYFYIQDENAGVQVYSYTKSFPALAEGDRVRVSGVKSTSRDETRMKTSVAEDIVVLSHGDVPAARTANALEEQSEGMLVHIEGIITAKDSSSFTLDDKFHIVVKAATAINLDEILEGAQVSVEGIVSQYDTDYRLLPRRDEDITIIEEDHFAIVQQANAASPQTILPSAAPRWSANSPLLQGILSGALGVIALVALYHFYQRRQQERTARAALAPTMSPDTIKEELPQTIWDLVLRSQTLRDEKFPQTGKDAPTKNLL